MNIKNLMSEYYSQKELSNIIDYYNLFETFDYYYSDDGEKLNMERVSISNQLKAIHLIQNGYTLDKLKKDFEGLTFEWVYRLLIGEEK